jgi:hypothetical protein
MAGGLNVGALGPDRLSEPLLLATLSGYYAQIERRFDGAVDRRAPAVSHAIASAAIDLFLATCEPPARADLEAQRAVLVEVLVAQRAALDEAVAGVARNLPRPRFYGPIGSVFTPIRRVNSVVIGTPGRMHAYARIARDQFMADAPVVESTQVTWPSLEGRNAVLYGSADSPLISELLAELSWQVTSTYVAFGDRKIEGENLILIACRARPSDPTLADLIYTSADELNLLGINGLHHGPSDFVVGRRNKTGRFQIVSRSNFARGPEGELLANLER